MAEDNKTAAARDLPNDRRSLRHSLTKVAVAFGITGVIAALLAWFTALGWIGYRLIRLMLNVL